jgi:hypothetical protein
MRMSFDGGNTWNTPVKIVGTDGRDGVDGMNGAPGSDATVNAETVFNALTDDGANQGMFPFYTDEGNTQLFINAEYIKTGQLSADRIKVHGDDVLTTTDDGNLYIKRIYGDSSSQVVIDGDRVYPGMYYLEVQSNFQPWEENNSDRIGADLYIKRVTTEGDGILANGEDLVYGFVFELADGDDDDYDEPSVNFIVGESSYGQDRHSIFGYNYAQGKTYFKGDWKASYGSSFDFTDATVTGLGVVPVFG